jgi:hypothetical protein
MITVQPTIEKVWKPNTGKQELFLSLPDSIFEQFYGGAAGGGKSEALLMKPLIKQWTDVKGFKGLIVRRTFAQLEESLIQRSQSGKINADGSEIPSYNDFGATYNKSNKKWTFPSGATITFGHAEEESDVRKYDTAEYNYIAFDELTSFTEFQYNFLAFSRCRSTNPSIPANVCSASNPGNIGHGWVRKRFVEPYPTGGKILVQNIGGVPIKRIFIQAFLTDNPKLMEGDPLYKVRLEMLTEAEKRAKLYGDWWTFSGQVFDEWRLAPFADEPPTAQHVIPSQTFDNWIPRILAIDWGYEAMTYALFGCALPNKRAVAYREYHSYKETTKTWTTNLANICLSDGIDPYIVLDPSAWQHRESETIADKFSQTWLEITGKSPRLEKATNDRIGGKMLVHDYLRWKSRPVFTANIVGEYRPEHADWILRNQGLDAYKKYQGLFAVQPQEVQEILPKLLVTEDCPLLIKTLPLCVYDDKGSNVEDVKEFKGDDPYDGTRYFCKGIEKLFSTSVSREAIELRRAEIVSAQNNNNDMTSFYRKMEFLEQKNRLNTRKIIRFGRGRRHYV